MTIKGLLAGIALMLLAMAAPASAQTNAFRHKVYDSSIQLYILEADLSDGGTGKEAPFPDCTAHAFQKTDNGYLLLTAAHCVITEHKGLFAYDEPAADGMLSVAYGNPGDNRPLIPVTIKMIGNWREGWDIAVLNMDTKIVLPVIPLGDDTKLEMGDRLVSVSAPMGGQVKYWYEGYMSANRNQIDPSLGRTIRSWRYSIFVEIPGYSGSSGAAVISVDQQAIIGIFVAECHTDAPQNERMSAVLVSVSAVKEFMANPKLHLSLEK
jgi:hypothetical protein